MDRFAFDRRNRSHNTSSNQSTAPNTDTAPEEQAHSLFPRRFEDVSDIESGLSACRPSTFQFNPSVPRYSNADDYELDDYDIALLAEPNRDRQWQATRGLSRISLPPRSVHSSSAMTRRNQADRRQQDVLDDSNHHPAALVPLSREFQSNPFVLTSQAPRSSSSAGHMPSSPSARVHNRRNLHPPTRPQHEGRATISFEKDHSEPRNDDSKEISRTNQAEQTPIVQGIQLVPTRKLPDRFRSLFTFHIFNAVQSRCFDGVFGSDDNLVVSAPTGSGKTVIFELAICRLLMGQDAESCKIVYMAPTKSLCAERYKSWNSRFGVLGLRCAELTGDTESGQLPIVQSASIIITTPEKWDSITRRWKDHQKLMQLIKLFLIDEVHILKDVRGATLEAVVSRMKSVGARVRFIALSATVPNSQDVATWLGKSQHRFHESARREVFGEEFRPVKLQKHVVSISWNGNDFGFDQACDQKLPEIISKYSAKKPILVFCCTRKSTVVTAKALAAAWNASGPKNRQWQAPRNVTAVADPEIRSLVKCGVAAHHAGLDLADRTAIEEAYLQGNIKVICCTSTLAVGVNLPCYLVIIKNTVTWQPGGFKEYSDLEMMQMLGRAGRPQFEDSAVAVIITKQEKASKYERLVSGSELLESCLHLNLIDHLICLGTVKDIYTAKRWLSSTFLSVRLVQNPDYYKLGADSTTDTLEQMLEEICQRDIELLHSVELVKKVPRLQSTPLGDAMARYYVKFETMKLIVNTPRKAKVSEILSVLAMAEEFAEIRFRQGEKALYKALNGSPSMRFPIKNDLTLPAHKTSIIIQSELGSVDYPTRNQLAKLRNQYLQDRAIIFSNIHRLIRCVIDCAVHNEDAVGVRNSLELSRSLAAQVWDNSPLQMKQIPNIGPVAVRKLALAGISSIETLEASEPHRINSVLGKQPGFGETVLHKLKDFPKVYLSVKSDGYSKGKDGYPAVKLTVSLGFLNDKTPRVYNSKQVYICFLAETSDGQLIHFKRHSSSAKGQNEIRLSAPVVNATQRITCYAMCDEIAGTLRTAELNPGIPQSAFPPVELKQAGVGNDTTNLRIGAGLPRPNKSVSRKVSNVLREGDGFQDRDLDDAELVDLADTIEFRTLEEIERKQALKMTQTAKSTGHEQMEDHSFDNPQQLENGKWKCNHRCKDKSVCKHLCCREGLDNPPRRGKAAPGKESTATSKTGKSRRTGSATNTLARPFKPPSSLQDKPSTSTQPKSTRQRDENGAQGFQALDRLHDRSTTDSTQSLKRRNLPSKFLEDLGTVSKRTKIHHDNTTDDYDADWMDDLPSMDKMLTVPIPGLPSIESVTPSRHSGRKLNRSTGEKLEINVNRVSPQILDADFDLEDYNQPITISTSSHWSHIQDEVDNRGSPEPVHYTDTDYWNNEEEVEDRGEPESPRLSVIPAASPLESPFFSKVVKKNVGSAREKSRHTISQSEPSDVAKMEVNPPAKSTPLSPSMDLANRQPDTPSKVSTLKTDPWAGLPAWMKEEYGDIVEIVDHL